MLKFSGIQIVPTIKRNSVMIARIEMKQ